MRAGVAETAGPGSRDRTVTAVLGPTNTGKTHYAIERMLGHRNGVIGLPLRLLAREVYDRIVALRGPSVVALVTGEERIVPGRAAYWVCTVEAMPTGMGTEFLAVDEIQLCGDPDRGHIFTDRLLNARGLSETLFLGADSIRSRIAALIPGAQFRHRDRLSQLSWAGVRKVSRMPRRSAIVGFSVDDVYAIAELLRRQKGGAAVVMGALSPRTRNAQVEMYQNGDVQHLVATDAIGMGLNLDIAHVAFSGVVKFDGRRHRHLAANELAQIAGRAGRHTTDGSFGVTAGVPPLEPELVDAIENNRFAPLRKLLWRNSQLEFGSPEALEASLVVPPEDPDLRRARDADDLLTLRTLKSDPGIRDRIKSVADVRLLWDVCRLPDFRKVSEAEHAGLCATLFDFLHDRGGVPDDWLAAKVARIDRTEGDIDALSTRLAFVRTWTYVAQRNGWVDDPGHWRGETRAVEDRLSDALHERLTQRFVDRRTSVLMRRLEKKERPVAEVTENGEVSIDGQFIGRLDGFRFLPDPSADPEQAGMLRSAAVTALAPVLSLRSDKIYNAPDTEFDLTEQGGLMWGEYAVGKLVRGASALAPVIEPFVDEDAAPEIAERVKRRLSHYLDRHIAAQFEPLLALRDDEALSGMARGVGFQLVDALGILQRSAVADDVKSLDQDQRAGLRRHGVRFGQFTVFMPALLKPKPTRLRLVLSSLYAELQEFPEAPPPGLVTVPALAHAPKGYYTLAGYRRAGERAVRIDMLERLADMTRTLDAKAGFEATADMLSITGLTLEQFSKLMEGLGYEVETGERVKVKKEPAAKAAPAATKPARISEAAAGEKAVEGGAVPDAEAPAGDVPETGGADSEAARADAPETGDAVPGGDASDAEAFSAATPAQSEALQAVADEPAVDAAPAAEAAAETAEAPAEAAAESAPAEAAEAEGGPVADEVVAEAAVPEETETYFIFRRSFRRRREGGQSGRGEAGQRRAKPGAGQGRRPKGEGKPRPAGKPARDGKSGKPGKPQRGGKPQQERAGRAEKERMNDPDNPFAALLALKDGK